MSMDGQSEIYIYCYSTWKSLYSCAHCGVVSTSLSSLSLTVQTGSISEQEFAMRIEKDLHSQHQPSLLPFLQVYSCSSVILSGTCTCVCWGEREQAPTSGVNGCAVSRYIYIYVDVCVRIYVHCYCTCAALLANVAGWIRNRVSPAFSACIGSGLSQSS